MSTPHPSSAEATAALRVAALTRFPGELGRKFGISDAIAIGACMEFRVAGAVISLICFIDGNVSLYFSTGGGMVGAGGRKPVREAAIKLVQFANSHLPEMAPCAEFPLPEAGRTSFYALTPSAAFVARASDSELAECRHPFAELFSVGQCVITRLRQIDEEAAEKHT